MCEEENLTTIEDWLNIEDSFFEEISLSEENGKSLNEGNLLDDESSQSFSRKNKKRKRNYKKPNKKKKKMTVLRANYFVGIQVSNPQIHKMVRMVQEKIIKDHPHLLMAKVSVKTLHLTLAVMHLSDMKQIERASEVVKECSVKFREKIIPDIPVKLSFSGLKTFGNQVLYVGVEDSEGLRAIQSLAHDLARSFEHHELHVLSKKKISPHLTVLKLSKMPHSKEKINSKIHKSMYEGMETLSFGNQVIKSVQLLSMTKPKDDKGYYYCSHEELLFDITSLESGDHSECCEKPFLVDYKEIKKFGDDKRGIHTSSSVNTFTINNIGKVLSAVGAVGVIVAFIYKYCRNH